MPAAPFVLDAHIHLWPATALQSTNHKWMTPNHQLAKQHGISDYKSATQSVPAGFVYVETDRYLPSAYPDHTRGKNDEKTRHELKGWAKEPLEELKFLRRIVKDNGQEGDGFGEGDGALMKGCVIWAPFHLPSDLFEHYITLAREAAGAHLWSRVVGFRYLLQGKTGEEVRKLTASDDWLENIASLGRGRDGKGWAFDVGVDTNRDGEEPLERVAEMIEAVRLKELSSGSDGQGVRFVLNHLCKPNLSQSTPSPRWKSALSRLAADRNVYMKLSGAFNEFDSTPSTVPEIATALSPFVDIIFETFPDSVMFGSDWPVCNVGGPRGESGNWPFWMEVVESVMTKRGFSDHQKGSVWWRAASDAYALSL